MLQLGIACAAQAAVLLLGSGRLNWWPAWTYLALYVAMIAFTRIFVHDPELFAERAQMQKDAKGWDKLLSVFYSLSGLAVLVVAALDARYGITPLPRAASAVGLMLLAAGFGVGCWAMASNRFFSSFVRIQTDRGHTVATGGPYRFVRHPGYVGFAGATVGASLLLGSGWSLVAAAFSVLILVVRTALEDRTLLAELVGYREYAARVRYRLVPGAW